MSYNYRKDGRTDEEYKNDMLKHTFRENIWADILKAEWEDQGYKVHMEDFGVDASGKVIKKGKSGEFERPDKKYTIDDNVELVEIKTCDQKKDYKEIPFMTFKSSSLRSAIKYNSLIVICDRKWRMLLYPAAIEKIIEEKSPQSFKNFAGGKPSYRIYNKEFGKYVTDEVVKDKIRVCRWKSKAQKLIKENEDKLFFKTRKKNG